MKAYPFALFFIVLVSIAWGAAKCSAQDRQVIISGVRWADGSTSPYNGTFTVRAIPEFNLADVDGDGSLDRVPTGYKPGEAWQFVAPVRPQLLRTRYYSEVTGIFVNQKGKPGIQIFTSFPYHFTSSKPEFGAPVMTGRTAKAVAHDKPSTRLDFSRARIEFR